MGGRVGIGFSSILVGLGWQVGKNKAFWVGAGVVGATHATARRGILDPPKSTKIKENHQTQKQYSEFTKHD